MSALRIHPVFVAGAVLVAAAAAGVVLTVSRAAQAPAAARPAAVPTRAPPAAAPRHDHNLARQPWTAAGADPFRSVSFAPPPAAPVLAQAPPPAAEEKPVAPPFPYQFFGRMVAVDGKTLTYLIRDGNLVQVREGEVIDGNYRIDAASETQLQVTYLPLNEQSTLALQTAAQ